MEWPTIVSKLTTQQLGYAISSCLRDHLIDHRHRMTGCRLTCCVAGCSYWFAYSPYLSQYPGAGYVCAYESEKFGYWIHRQLLEKDIECMVVNPADIPTAQKDDLQKTDPRDARGIAKALQNGLLKGIYIPCEQQGADRSLVRQRKKIWSDLFVVRTGSKIFLIIRV